LILLITYCLVTKHWSNQIKVNNILIFARYLLRNKRLKSKNVNEEVLISIITHYIHDP
jgi:hypothetical protein